MDEWWMDWLSREKTLFYRLDLGLHRLAIWKSFDIWVVFNTHEIFTILKSIYNTIQISGHVKGEPDMDPETSLIK